MIPFWLAVGAMVLAAIGIAVIPVFRARESSDTSRTALNARVYRDRAEELDTDLAEGRLEAEQHRELKDELGRTLLDDSGESEAVATRDDRSHWIAAALFIALPALGLLYYYQTAYQGPSAEWIDLRARMNDTIAQALDDPDDLPPGVVENLPDFARALQSQLLAEDSKDARAWLLLGVSYLQLQAPIPARDALERAYRIDPERVQTMVSLAQARILGSDGRMDPTSAELLASALRKDPSHQGALLMYGFGAFNAGRFQDAIGAWERLLSLVEPGSERARLIENTIAQARRSASSPSPAAQPGSSAAASEVALDVTVEMASEVAANLSAGDTLFVFAKARQGPPMPLAVVRQAAQGFPVRVTLDDSRAMAPNMKLSDFKEVLVEARVSKSGNVAATPGDLESSPAPVDLSNARQSVSIVIDHVVR
jgi:cytochrome c-type biogenesis protein CcmH